MVGLYPLRFYCAHWAQGFMSTNDQSMKIKFLSLVLCSVFWAVFVAGCNTTRGVGKDIEKAGDKIQDATR